MRSRRFFGGCPHCGGYDGHVLAHGQVWIVCDTHRTKWRSGADAVVNSSAEDFVRRTRAAEVTARTQYRNVFAGIDGANL